MMNRKIFFLCSALFSAPLMAFPCFFTLVKDSCWTDYTVTVNVTNVDTNQPIITVSIPAGQTWVRQPFTCQPSEKIVYTATFEPSIWEQTEGQVYKAKRYWQLPSAATSKQKAWEVPVCFPAAFAEVPFPPKASGNCKCDFSSVTPIPLQSQ
ncbi:MAG: hypothetical protein Q8M03_08470 [Legionella sp.]|nr:hypothetical protein [Legionella sp.]